MMATSTQLDNGEGVISKTKGQQWTEESCFKKTSVDQSRGWGDDEDNYHNGSKDNWEPSTKASCSEWVCGDHSRQGTDDDEYRNGWGDDANTEPEHSTEEGGSEGTDSGYENEHGVWEHSTEESVSETTNDDQTYEEHVDEAQTKDSNDGPKDCSDAFLPLPVIEDWYKGGNLLPGMAGYVDKCKDPENDAERVKSPAEIRYEELPFVTKHYFLHHALHILEAICFRTGERRFRKYLDDPVWKSLNLVINPWRDDPDIRRVYGDWLTEDGVEVKWWVWFYGERAPGMPPPSKTGDILNSIYSLRNAALHRGDEGDLDFKEWELAMQVPELLKDDVGMKEMADLAEYVLGDGTMNEDVRRDMERKMYTPRLSMTKYQLLERIQTLLEESCYDLAVKKIPDVLKMNGWDCAEKVELPKWIGIFENTEVVEHCDNLAKDFFRGRDSGIWTGVIVTLLHYARMYIRNAAAHREPVSDEDLVNRVHAAIRTAILLSDWPRALEIEVVSEMWFEGTSRQAVLERLARSYRDGKIQSEYERRRRCELKLFLRNQRGTEEEEEEEGEGLQMMSAECDAKGQIAERTQTRSIWSPSMHECLKMAEVIEVVKNVKEVDEEVKWWEMLKRWMRKIARWKGGNDSEDEAWGTPVEDTASQLC